MSGEVYFSFKGSIKTKKDYIFLDDVCDIFFAQEGDRTEKLKISLKLGVNTINGIKIVKLLMAEYPKYKFINVGEAEMCVVREAEQSTKVKKIMMFLVSAIILFFGGAITIMNFHADVNMPKVHQNVFRFFGGAGEPPVAVGIFYTVGLFVGFVSILSVFAKSRKTPGLLDLELFSYKKEVLSFLKKNEEGEEEK